MSNTAGVESGDNLDFSQCLPGRGVKSGQSPARPGISLPAYREKPDILGNLCHLCVCPGCDKKAGQKLERQNSVT